MSDLQEDEFQMFTPDGGSFYSLFVRGIPIVGIRGSERKSLFSMPPRKPPPPSRGILDRPGGEPDGAERGWEFRELGGGTHYRPPSLLSV